MTDFNISLLREKFTVDDADGQSLTFASNRIDLALKSKLGETENFIIRTQTMHTCVRLAARMIGSFLRAGPLLKRPEAFDWADIWDQTLEGHERNYNPQIWGTVYHAGKPVFRDGSEHAFLDLIEQFDATNPDAYDIAVEKAEDAFGKAGKEVKIAHDTTVGVVVSASEKIGRTGIILRGAYKTSTFNFTVESKTDAPVNPAQCMNIAAAFLEGIQLAFRIGKVTALIDLGQLKKGAPDYTEVILAKNRLPRLHREIIEFENRMKVRYRPEKPNFQDLIASSQRETEKRFDT